MKKIISISIIGIYALILSISGYAQEKVFQDLAEIPGVQATYINGKAIDIVSQASYFKWHADLYSMKRVLAIETINYIDYDPDKMPLSELSVTNIPATFNTENAKKLVKEALKIIKKLKLELVSEQKKDDTVNNLYISPISKKDGKFVQSFLVYQIYGNMYNFVYLIGEIDSSNN